MNFFNAASITVQLHGMTIRRNDLPSQNTYCCRKKQKSIIMALVRLSASRRRVLWSGCIRRRFSIETILFDFMSIPYPLMGSAFPSDLPIHAQSPRLTFAPRFRPAHSDHSKAANGGKIFVGRIFLDDQIMIRNPCCIPVSSLPVAQALRLRIGHGRSKFTTK
jgi:hypothetical protein